MNLAQKFLATLLFLPWIAQAQSVSSLNEMRVATDQIMEQVGRGNLDGAFVLLKTRTLVPAAEFDAMVGQAKLQLPMMAQRFGDNLGFEFLREDRVGEHLARYIYIQRFEKHAMRWIFYIYRGKAGWLVNSFRFDDQLPAIFP